MQVRRWPANEGVAFPGAPAVPCSPLSDVGSGSRACAPWSLCTVLVVAAGDVELQLALPSAIRENSYRIIAVSRLHLSKRFECLTRMFVQA